MYFNLTNIIIIIIIILIIVCINNLRQKSADKKNEKFMVLPNLKNRTIISVLKWNSENYPDQEALIVRKDNNWESISYKNYYNNAKNFAKGINCWIGHKANVAIIGSNSAAWFYAHLGCMINSGISVGIYPTTKPKMCDYIVNHARIDVLVVEDEQQLEKFYESKNNIKLVLYYSPISHKVINKFKEKKIPVISFGVFINNTTNIKKKYKCLNIGPKLNDIATIIYTSGTTGESKGAVLTHKNIMSSVKNIIDTMLCPNFASNSYDLVLGERFVSYLPLNHIAAQMMDIYIPISILGTVWFADKNALKSGKSTLVPTLKDARPTIFLGVPRVWEKIMEGIENKNTSIIPLFLIKNRITREIGLDKCKYCISTSAPLSDSAKKYFDYLGLTIYDIYGLSETCGPITLSLPNMYKEGSVGVPIRGTHIKIDADGEILVSNESLFIGYHNDKESTKKIFKIIDKKKWFKTGDIGYIKDDYLFITGRKKELIITSGGENIYPISIENKIINSLKFIEYAIVIGDKKKYLTILLVPKNKDLNKVLIKSFPNKKEIKNMKTIRDLENNEFIKSYIDKQIEIVNSESISNAHKIQKWKILNTEFTVGEELTPTLKLRRYFIQEKYKDVISKLY